MPKMHKKAFIVANLDEWDDEIKENMYPLMVAISSEISKHGVGIIGDKLHELGLEDPYGHLFVKIAKEQMPTVEYHLQELSKIEDSKFEVVFPVVNWLLVEMGEENTLLEKQKISQNQVEMIMGITLHFLDGLAGGELSEKTTHAVCKGAGLSEAKIKTISDTVRANREFWRNTQTFSNMEESISMKVIKAQNDEILRSIRDLAGLLKGENDSNSQPYRQYSNCTFVQPSDTVMPTSLHS